MKGILKKIFKYVNSSFTRKLLIIFFFSCIIPLIILGSISYGLTYSIAKENSIDSNLQKAIQLNDGISLVFKNANMLLSLDSEQSVIEYLQVKETSQKEKYEAAKKLITTLSYTKRLYSNDMLINDIYVLGINGNCICERYGVYYLNSDITQIPSTNNILKNQGRTVVFFNDLSHFGLPVYNNAFSVGKVVERPVTHEILGVIIVDIDELEITNLCQSLCSNSSDEYMVFDQTMEQLYADNSKAGRSSLSDEHIKEIRNNSGGYFIDKTRNNRFLVVYNTLPEIGWKVVGKMDMNELMAQAYSIRRLTVFAVILSLIMIFLLFYFLSANLTGRLKKLEQLIQRSGYGDFNISVESKGSDEIYKINQSFNTMMKRIGDLLETSKREQHELKTYEMKLLQAQINPHFLYNTLDSIIWLTESGDKEGTIRLTKHLASFFRITLNNGLDFITVDQEVFHVKSYMEIQKMRYGKLFDFSVLCEDELLEYLIPKLTIQPIVENALYHGIKNKKSGGIISVICRREGTQMVIRVSDTGIGIPADELEALRQEIRDKNIKPRIGFGLRNVNQRIILYYGADYGIKISSEGGIGTEVTINLPLRSEPNV